MGHKIWDDGAAKEKGSGSTHRVSPNGGLGTQGRHLRAAPRLSPSNVSPRRPLQWCVVGCAGPTALMETDGGLPLLSPPPAITPLSETAFPVSVSNDTPSPAVGQTVNWKGTSEVFHICEHVFGNETVSLWQEVNTRTLCPSRLCQSGRILSCEAENLNVI